MGWIADLLKGKEKLPPVPVTDATFREEVLRSDRPVIVDFWSTTCAPCQKLVPVLTDIHTEFNDRVKVVSAEVSGNLQTAAQLGVRATPTVVVFRGGKELGRIVGFRPRSYFQGMIETEFPATSPE